jgi:uncharacterized membrane protein required for colicin V production
MLLSLTELPNQEMWQKSKFIPKFQESATWLQTLIPADLNDIVNEKLEGKNILTPSEDLPEGITPSVEESTTN